MTDVHGYGGKYRVDTNGNIYSTAKKRFLRPTFSVRGYYVVNVNKKIRYVHQLVAETFLSSDYKSKNLFVDHIDRNKKNNNLSNLRLVTKSENAINVNRPFMLCIFKREDSGNYRVIHASADKTFKTYEDALAFRMSLT